MRMGTYDVSIVERSAIMRASKSLPQMYKPCFRGYLLGNGQIYSLFNERSRLEVQSFTS